MSEESTSWHNRLEDDFESNLTLDDRNVLDRVMTEFGSASKNELITHTYSNYPYYTVNSVIADKYIDASVVTEQQNKLKATDCAIYTIGYEGKTLEEYLNLLLADGIKVLIDVRKNPLSMKYGFSKNQLKNACAGVGITYMHIPQLGIVSDKRKNLESKSDYDALFAEYVKASIPTTTEYQAEAAQVVNDNKRVALTCFEADPEYCHRSYLAPYIAEYVQPEVRIRHIH